MNENIRNIVLTAVLAALTFVATMFIQIPLINGYANVGDSVIFIAGIVLGPVWGAVAAGVGSALADIALSYGVYAPATLVIKAVMGLIIGLIYKKAENKESSAGAFITMIIAAIIAEAVMVAGYFLFETVLYSSAATALLSLGGNALQGIVNAIVAVLLYKVLGKVLKSLRGDKM